MESRRLISVCSASAAESDELRPYSAATLSSPVNTVADYGSSAAGRSRRRCRPMPLEGGPTSSTAFKNWLLEMYLSLSSADVLG
jgi:hypothetical protein